MRRIILFFPTMVILVILLIVFTYFIRVKNELKLANHQIQFLYFKNSILKEGIFHSFDFNNYKIDLTDIEFFESGNALGFFKQKDSKSALFLLLEMSSCQKCVLDHINRLKEINKSELFTTYIGISGLNDRDFYAFISNYDISNISFRISVESFPGFDLSSIVYFVGDNKGNYSYFFAPTEHIPELTDLYLKKIIGKYSQ